MHLHQPLLRRSALVLLGFAGAACFPEFGGYTSGGEGGSTTVTGPGGQGGAVTTGEGGVSTSGKGGEGGQLGTGGLAGAGGGFPLATCADLTRNGNESGVDCGGDACLPCPIGQPCTSGADCESGNCNGTCQAAIPPVCPTVDPDNPTCADCTKNGGETGADCGGDSCSPCGIGLGCLSDADCASANCDGSTMVCAPFVTPTCPAEDLDNPTCFDCVRNGDETAPDCGGDACLPCADSLTCLMDSDCESLNCDGTNCQPNPSCPTMVDPDNPTCADCEMNGGETDEDCGGDACPPCGPGKDCVVDADCASDQCGSGGCL